MIVDEDRFKSWLGPQPKIHSLEELMVISQQLSDQFADRAGPSAKISADFNNTILILWQIYTQRHTGRYDKPLIAEIAWYAEATDLRKILTTTPDSDPLPNLDYNIQRMKAVQRSWRPAVLKDFPHTFKAVEDPSFQKLIESVQVLLLEDDIDKELKAALLQSTQHIGFTLSLIDHPLHQAVMKNMRSEDIQIKNGPVTPNELLYCALFFMLQSGMYQMYDEDAIANATEMPDFENPVSSAYLISAMVLSPVLLELMEYLAAQQSDLGDPLKIVQDMAEQQAQTLARIAETHLMGAERLAVLTRYYYEHNQHKLGGSAEFAAIMTEMELGLAVIMMGITPELSSDPVVQQRHHEILMEKIPELLAYDIARPSLEQVIAECEAAIDQQEKGKPQKAARYKEKFHNFRRNIPDGMEEVILLHYAEREDIREMRKRLFGAQKEEFLKTVATENAEELMALGLSRQQIARMKDDGKIPDGSGLSVEHIIDRHHGGTNHAENFIVLPGEVNQQKDELKQKQIRAYGGARSDKGCWIISWVPKKREDGTYPRVWPVNAHQDVSHEAQMEASAPNPLQL